jgi:DNA-nicking Smr family endonuclease
VRTLSADEAELWAKVAATIRPLSREPVDEPIAAPEVRAAAPVNPPRAAPRGRVPPARPAVAAPPPRPSLQAATLDGSWDKGLRSGNIIPDRTLDLHGHHLDGAWSAIDHTLERAIAAGDRVVLLITGHERRGEPPIVRGRIRAAVHDWLASSRHASQIAAVRAAHRRHGGGGSLYIILRRR